MHDQKRPEKKSETLEIRLPYSKKQALKAACERDGITVSHAMRTFIDAYLKQSQRAKLKTLATEISMTLVKHPAKTLGGISAAIAAGFATMMITALPSAADRDAQPITPPVPVYPSEMAMEGIGAKCEARFDVTPEGRVAENLDVTCTHEGFVDATINAVSTLQFEPKIVNGKAVTRKGVVYPLEYLIASD